MTAFHLAGPRMTSPLFLRWGWLGYNYSHYHAATTVVFGGYLNIQPVIPVCHYLYLSLLKTSLKTYERCRNVVHFTYKKKLQRCHTSPLFFFLSSFTSFIPTMPFMTFMLPYLYTLFTDFSYPLAPPLSQSPPSFWVLNMLSLTQHPNQSDAALIVQPVGTTTEPSYYPPPSTHYKDKL